MNKQKIGQLLKDGAEAYLSGNPVPDGTGQKAKWLRHGYVETQEAIDAVVDECQLLTRGYDV